MELYYKRNYSCDKNNCYCGKCKFTISTNPQVNFHTGSSQGLVRLETGTYKLLSTATVFLQSDGLWHLAYSSSVQLSNVTIPEDSLVERQLIRRQADEDTVVATFTNTINDLATGLAGVNVTDRVNIPAPGLLHYYLSARLLLKGAGTTAGGVDATGHEGLVFYKSGNPL